MLTSQGENPLPVLPVAGKDTAPEFPLWGNSQMLTLPVLAGFGTSWTLGFPAAVTQLADLLQFRPVQAHTNSD